MSTIELPIGIVTYPQLVQWIWVCSVICAGLALINCGLLFMLLSKQSEYKRWGSRV